MTEVPVEPVDGAPAGWPALGRERQLWSPLAVAGLRAEIRPTPTSYWSAVPAAISGLTPVVDRATAALAEEATQELSRFDSEHGSRVASFAPVLLRSEAASSSQIENLTASARSIFSAELGAKAGTNAELITANTRSMQAAIDLSRDLDAEAVLAVHRVLMEGQPRHRPGRWREEPVWIGTRSESPAGAEYVAPHHARVAKAVEDLVAFMRRDDVPSLTSVAVAHAQFETIHPFTDGNGRTGRALAQAGLRHRGVTRNVAVPVSAGLLADVTGYHQALTAYRSGDVTPVVHAFAEAALRAVVNSRHLVDDIDAIRASWSGRLTVRRSSGAWRLLDVLVRRPVIDATTAASELGVQRPNVYPPLRALEDAGILRSRNEHRKGPFWRSDEVLGAVDAFAERAGRRSSG